MGTSRLYRNSREKCKVQEETNQKIMLFPCFFYDFLAKNHPKTFRQSVRSFCTGLSLPRPLPIHFTSVLHFRFFFEQKCFLFSSILEVFPLFSLFVELLRLRDHSQIVDLIFPLRTVASRASETSKTPHS